MSSADSVNFSNFMFLDTCFSVMTICRNTVWTCGTVFLDIVGTALHVPSFEYLHSLYKWLEGVNRHAICSWKGELLLLFSTSVPLTFISQNLRSSPSLGCIRLRAKQTQHCWPTTLNIVGCYMLRPFAHPVACCCAKFETCHTFSAVQTDATLLGWELLRPFARSLTLHYNRGGWVNPILAYTRRFRKKGVPFLGLGYMKG